MDNKQMLSLYIDATVVEKIKERAAKKDWSVNKYIAHVLARIVRER